MVFWLKICRAREVKFWGKNQNKNASFENFSRNLLQELEVGSISNI